MNTQPFLAAAHRPMLHNTRSELPLVRTPRPSIDYGAWAARIALTAIAAAVVFVLILRPAYDAYRATHPAAHVQAGRQG